MINWNEVTVGETVIVNDGGCQWSLLTRWGNYVLVGYANDMGRPWVEHIDDLSDWAIYDPWVEITDQCVWYKAEDSDFDWEIWYQNKRVPHENSKFKSDGCRVWKRKEGRDE